jgi:two-component system OmpR family response regulator
MSDKSIFIVEDEMMQREMLVDHLSKMSHYEVKAFETGEDCLAAIQAGARPVIIFLDYYLNSVKKEARDGLEILTDIKKLSPASEVVMLSGQDKIEVAVDVMKYGAFDYIVKGESAYYRAEKAVFNIYRFNKMKGDASMYKKLTITFGIAFVLMIALFLVMQQQGLISDRPGWF